jgi:RNase adaptor protein for sRNA GlmZ degradation
MGPLGETAKRHSQKLFPMRRIFITGMSGTGKTSVIEELRTRGFTAIDTDYDDWCELSTVNDESEWLLQEDRLHALLAAPLTSPLFVSGCSSNQGKFYKFFDYKILFIAPLPVMRERVTSRTSNPYGKSEHEWAEICRNHELIYPLLKQSADFEIDSSTMTITEIADLLTNLALN